jgi:predicted O-methyltransferase YrrM
MSGERRFGELPENIKIVLAEMELYALENLRARNVNRELGTLLYMAAKLKKSEVIVDVGTSNGCSAIYLAQAAKENGGKVVTIEKQLEKTQGASQNIIKVGLEDRVTIVPGRAQEVLPQLKQPIDFLFMDILPEEYLDCIRGCRDRLKKGAIVICDNFSGHRERDGKITARINEGNDFIEYCRGNFESVSEILNIGSGIVICTV